MTSYAWKRLQPSELPALERFLRSREEEAAGFIGRILRNGRLRFLAPLRGGVAIAVEAGGEKDSDGLPRIEGAILRMKAGLAFPLLPPRGRRPGADRLPHGLGGNVASVVGPEDDVERFEAALALRPLVAVPYDLMYRVAASTSLAGRDKPSGLRVERAGEGDLDDLAPLQEAYEKEEVLTAIHRFDAAGSRAGLARALRDQLVYVGRLDGSAVAKAATNARAFSVDQLGGIFVAPPYRRRGIGARVVSELLSRMDAERRDGVLFVKRGNEAARGLYDDLGFTYKGGYRADYFMP